MSSNTALADALSPDSAGQAYKRSQRLAYGLAVLVWLAVLGLVAFWGLKLLDRSAPTASGAREVSLAPRVQPVSFPSLGARFGAAQTAAPAPAAARYVVQGVVVDEASSATRAVLLSDKADAKPVVVRVGSKLADGSKVVSISRHHVVLSADGGAEEKLEVPKRAEIKSAALSAQAATQPLATSAAPMLPTPSVTGAVPASNPVNVGLPGAQLGELPSAQQSLPPKPMRFTPPGP